MSRIIAQWNYSTMDSMPCVGIGSIEQNALSTSLKTKACLIIPATFCCCSNVTSDYLQKFGFGFDFAERHLWVYPGFSSRKDGDHEAERKKV